MSKLAANYLTKKEEDHFSQIAEEGFTNSSLVIQRSPIG